MPHYVCIKWPTDSKLPAPCYDLTAGPYATYDEASVVAQELREEKDEKWGSDLGEYFVKSEESICSDLQENLRLGKNFIALSPKRKLVSPSCMK